MKTYDKSIRLIFMCTSFLIWTGCIGQTRSHEVTESKIDTVQHSFKIDALTSEGVLVPFKVSYVVSYQNTKTDIQGLSKEDICSIRITPEVRSHIRQTVAKLSGGEQVKFPYEGYESELRQSLHTSNFELIELIIDN